jgi:TRAP-type C4-dicarboxylate transport system permease small subunit
MTMGGAQPDGQTRREDDSGSGAQVPLGGSSLALEASAELLPRRPRLRTAFRAISLAEQVVGTALILVILILVLVQVAQRYLPGGWPWTGEVARLALVWCTFALSGYLMAHDRHISIRVVDLVLSRRGLGLVKAMGHLFVAVTCAAMAIATYLLIANDIGQRTPAAGIPLAWIYLAPLAGFTLTSLRAAMAIILVDVPEATREHEPAS